MNFISVKKLLENILSLVKMKWQFTLPSKSKILVYDKVTNIDFLFPKKKYEILPVRNEIININILFRAILNHGTKNLKDNYKKYFIEFVSPKVVYTGIDNNPAFYKLKDICDKPIYISVQNGLRHNKFFEECKKNLHRNQKLKADHVFVFGNNEKKRLSKVIKAKFHSIGNAFNNNFPIYQKKTKKKIKSIMFISQFDLAMKNNLDVPYNLYRKKKEQQIFNHLIRFCENRNIKLYFLQKRKDLSEIFFRSIFNNGNWIFLKKGTQQKTYQRLNNQQMVVFHSSTLGFEALAKGIKCASFNKVFPIPDEINAFEEKKKIHINFNKYPRKGPFWTDSESYSDYEEVLDKVIGFSDSAWKKIVKKYSYEIVSFDYKNNKLKKILKKIL